MLIYKTKIDGLLQIKNKIKKDNRGYFIEVWKKNELEKITGTKLVQENISYNKKKYTLRGLHAQIGNKKQAKLVRCIKGKILDVAVDFRKNSPTFLKYFKLILSENNSKQLFIPPDFLHGFITLESHSIVNYMCSNYYSKKHEINLNYLEPKINIKWGVDLRRIIISSKDKKAKFIN